jgi:hypothetical protein
VNQSNFLWAHGDSEEFHAIHPVVAIEKCAVLAHKCGHIAVVGRVRSIRMKALVSNRTVVRDDDHLSKVCGPPSLLQVQVQQNRKTENPTETENLVLFYSSTSFPMCLHLNADTNWTS